MKKLDYFKEISKIPRASFNEKAVIDYIENLAIENKLKTYRDRFNNLVVYKDAKKGYENHPTVILQAHTDMVADKTPDSNHDFSKDPIELIFDGEWIRANNTTLGADDGYGVSYILDIMTNDYPHPPLELVFTVEEEFGLSGVLKAEIFDKLKGKNLISLDSGDENTTCVSTSGGLIGEVSIPFIKDQNFKNSLKIKIGGLLGGHAGVDIDKEHASSIKIAGEILHKIAENFEIGIYKFAGGNKNNAIPRDAILEIGILESDIPKIKELLKYMISGYKAQYLPTDPGLSIEYSFDKKDLTAINYSDTKKIARILFLFPTGVFNNSPGLNVVWFSANLGILEMKDDKIRLEYYARSPQKFLIEKYKAWLLEIIEDSEYKYLQEFPGWEYEKNSHLRDILKIQ